MSLNDKACYVGDIVPNLVIFKKEDVKQFIKELKEELFGDGRILTDNEMIDIIDALSGKELI